MQDLFYFKIINFVIRKYLFFISIIFFASMDPFGSATLSLFAVRGAHLQLDVMNVILVQR